MGVELRINDSHFTFMTASTLIEGTLETDLTYICYWFIMWAVSLVCVCVGRCVSVGVYMF